MPFKKQEKKRKNKKQFVPKKINNHSSDEKNHCGIDAVESKSFENLVIQDSKVNQREEVSQIIGAESKDIKLLMLPPDENFEEPVEKKYDNDIEQNNLSVKAVNVRKTNKSTKTKVIAGPAIPAIKLCVENISPSLPAKEIFSPPQEISPLPQEKSSPPQVISSPQDYQQLQKEFEEYKKKKENEMQKLLNATTTKQLDITTLKKQKDKLEQNLNEMKEQEKENARKLDLKVLICEAKVTKIQQAYKQLNDEKFAALEKETRVTFANSLLNDKLTSVQKELELRKEQIAELTNQLTEANGKINKKIFDLEAGTCDIDVNHLKVENAFLTEKIMALEDKIQVNNSLFEDANSLLKKNTSALEKKLKAYEVNTNVLRNENDSLKEKVLALNEEVKAYEVNISLLRNENTFLKKNASSLEEKDQFNKVNTNILRDENGSLKEDVLALNEKVKAFVVNISLFRDENTTLKEIFLILNEEGERKNERIIELNERDKRRQQEKETFIPLIEDLQTLLKEKEYIIQNIKTENEMTKEEAYRKVAKVLVEGNENLVLQKLKLDAKQEVKLRKLKEKHLQELDKQKSNHAKQLKEISDINVLENDITVSYHETRYNQMQEFNQDKIDRITSSVQTLQNYIDQKVATRCVFKSKKINPMKISTFVTNIKKGIHFVNKK